MTVLSLVAFRLEGGGGGGGTTPLAMPLGHQTFFLEGRITVTVEKQQGKSSAWFQTIIFGENFGFR